ncbi:MAG: DUF167 domain-containing protein [bacterium]
MSDETRHFYEVYVKPLSKVSEIKKENSLLKAYLKSPPIDGRANEELIYLLSHYFKVKKDDIKIKSGRNSKRKLIQISKKGE